MTDKNTGGPAFPQHSVTLDKDGVTLHENTAGGMTLRDWYAGQALMGMIARQGRYKARQQDNHLHWHEAITKEASEIADAMIAERGPDEDRHEIGTEEGQTCKRFAEPDEGAPRGYKPKPCKGEMFIAGDETDDCWVQCDTCGEEA